MAFVVAVPIIVASTFVTLQWITPDYADVIIDEARQRILAAGNPPADLEERLAQFHAMYTPTRQSLFVIPATLVTGLVFSAGLGLVIRHRPSE